LSAAAVARRYAKALYELAAEDGVVDAVAVNLSALAQGVGELDGEALQPGALGMETRKRIADKVGATLGADSLPSRFVRVLAENDRLAELPAISDWFGRIRDVAAGRVRALVTTPVEISAADVDRLTAVFSRLVGKQVVPELAIDDTLIGGVVVEVEGRVFDGSVRTSLQRLSERMAGQSGRPTT
jgi:F-type H+-transporting ATPase subunit delta